MYILLYTLHSYVYVLLSRLHTNDAVFVCSTILSNKHYDVMYFMHQTYPYSCLSVLMPVRSHVRLYSRLSVLTPTCTLWLSDTYIFTLCPQALPD